MHGKNRSCGAFTLAIMILPLIMWITEEAFLAVELKKDYTIVIVTQYAADCPHIRQHCLFLRGGGGVQ